MDISSIRRIAKSKIAVLSVASVVALFAVGSTEAGQRVLTQIGISDTFAKTTDAAGRMADNTSNAVQAFLGRSPGARGATDTLKGKAKPAFAENAAAPRGPKPTQRALGKVFDEPLQSLAGPLALAPAPVFLPLDGVSSAASIPVAAFPVGSGFFAPIIGGGGSGGGFVGGGGGGGGGAGPGPIGDAPISPAPPPAPPAPPIITAVPEPSTWMLLLLGFAAVGASLRRTVAAQKSGSKRAGNCATAS